MATANVFECMCECAEDFFASARPTRARNSSFTHVAIYVHDPDGGYHTDMVWLAGWLAGQASSNMRAVDGTNPEMRLCDFANSHISHSNTHTHTS